MRVPLRELGRRPQRRLARSRVSASSACRSRSGTRSTRTASRDYDHPIVADRGEPAGRPDHRPAPGYSEEAQRGVPGGFMRRPRRDGHVGDLVPHPAARRRLGARRGAVAASPSRWTSRPQAHDIIRTWLFCRVVRAHLENDWLPWKRADDLGLRRRPRPQEDEQVEGQRGRPDRRSSTASVPTPSLARRHGAPRHGLPVRRTQMKVGRRLAMKILNAASSCCRSPSSPGRSPQVTDAARPRHARRAARAWSTEATAGVRGRSTTPTALEDAETFFWTFCDDYLELVKERAYDRPMPGGVGRAGAPLGPVDGCACSPRSAVRDRGGRGAGPTTPPSTARRGRRPPGVAGDPAMLGCGPAALIGVRRAKSEAKVSRRRRGLARGDRGPAAKVDAPRAPRRTICAPWAASKPPWTGSPEETP